MFKNDITGQPLAVSNKSTQVIIMALCAANHEGVISDTEYAMTYAEVCELGRLPQALGGRQVDKEEMSTWMRLKSWAPTPTKFTVRSTRCFR